MRRGHGEQSRRLSGMIRIPIYIPKFHLPLPPARLPARLLIRLISSIHELLNAGLDSAHRAWVVTGLLVGLTGAWVGTAYGLLVFVGLTMTADPEQFDLALVAFPVAAALFVALLLETLWLWMLVQMVLRWRRQPKAPADPFAPSAKWPLG